jgi:hypothetical protein
MASPYSTQPNLPVVVPRYADEPSMPAGATGTLFVLASGFGIGALVMLFGFLFLIGVGQVGHPTTSGPAAQSAATAPTAPGPAPNPAPNTAGRAVPETTGQAPAPANPGTPKAPTAQQQQH